MKLSAIVYTSNTGYTAEYANLLGEQTCLPVLPLAQAEQSLARGSRIIYLGWLMAGKVQGYRKAATRFTVCAVCGVGMGATSSQLADVRKTNALPGTLPLFTLQGGFDLARLHGVYKFMMTVMKKTVGRGLSEKPGRTPEEDAMLELLLRGGSRVSRENLADVLAWYSENGI